MEIDGEFVPGVVHQVHDRFVGLPLDGDTIQTKQDISLLQAPRVCFTLFPYLKWKWQNLDSEFTNHHWKDEKRWGFGAFCFQVNQVGLKTKLHHSQIRNPLSCVYTICIYIYGFTKRIEWSFYLCPSSDKSFCTLSECNFA